jgi:predicted transcriptional regulator of viral defense system
MLHNLSDALPRKVNLSLHADWTKRRLRVPKGVVVHHADVAKKDRVEICAVPVRTGRRTLLDCVDAHVSPELIETAVRQAVARSLIDKDDLKAIRARSRAA